MDLIAQMHQWLPQFEELKIWATMIFSEVQELMKDGCR